MAQYYQVVDSGQNQTEEIQATYSNIVDNQGVHYILQTENEAHQPYVLIENNTPVIAQFEQQPVYLVESPAKQMETQTMQSVPVVLNHSQLQSKVLMHQPQQHVAQQPVIVSPPPLRHIPRARPPIHGARDMNAQIQTPPHILNNRMRTPRSAVMMSNVPRMPRGPRVQSPRPGGIGGGGAGLRNVRPNAGNRPRQPTVAAPMQQQQMPIQRQDNDQSTTVMMEDGRMMPMAEYQKFMDMRKMQTEQRAALTNPNRAVAPQQVRPQTPLMRLPQPRLGIRPQGRPRTSMRPVRPPQPPVQPVPQIIPILPIEQPKRTARILQPNQSQRLPRVLREFTAPPEIKELINRTINDEEFENSIRMFVLLVCGEQRLITFTTPKEDCTIQEILDQVGVPLQSDTKIAISEINTDGINLVVSVGYEDDDEDEKQVPDTTTTTNGGAKSTMSRQPPPLVEVSRPLTPAPSPEPPKLIPGKMAVCTHCGYLSEDFNRCVRCKRKLPDGIKAMNTETAEALPKKKPTIAINLKSTTGSPLVSSGLKTLGNGIPSLSGPNLTKVTMRKRVKPKAIEQEPMVVTLSSDDEEEDKDGKSGDDKSPVRDKEPTIAELKEGFAESPKMGTSLACTSISCRKISIGSYKYTPSHDVLVNIVGSSTCK